MSPAAKPVPFGPDLVAMVRKRVPESEVEDIVQSALAAAIESPHAPADSESLRRWIFGVAKNKVVDYHRRADRGTFDLPDVPMPAPPPEPAGPVLQRKTRPQSTEPSPMFSAAPPTPAPGKPSAAFTGSSDESFGSVGVSKEQGSKAPPPRPALNVGSGVKGGGVTKPAPQLSK